MSQLLITESPLIILPSLAKLVGINEAIFLQQVHYWLGKSTTMHKGSRWTYNTVQQWADQLEIFSVATIERVVARLKKAGLLLVEKLNPNKSDRTNFYSINYSKLAQLLGQDASLNLLDSSPQNEVMEHRKKMASIASNCGNLLTENSLEFTENKNAVLKKNSHLPYRGPTGLYIPMPPHSNWQPCRINSGPSTGSYGNSGWMSSLMIPVCSSGWIKTRRIW